MTWSQLPDVGMLIAVISGSLLLAVITVLLWWASRHCVASAATGWRYVTWEEMTAAEAAIRGGSDEALGAGPEKVLDGRYAS